MPTIFSGPSRRHLLADNQALRDHLKELSRAAEAQERVSSVVYQPVLLPTTVVQARIELNLVRADRTRMERLNDGLRQELRQKDAELLAVMTELRQARLAALQPQPVQHMGVPWQPMSSAA